MVIGWLIFTVVVGACVGSFLNVVIYRLPAGVSIVRPPSACPQCGHRLAWHDNVPVLGWLWLKGRCRYCSSPISPQYPIIEATTAGLFGVWYAVCYMSPLRPDFAGAGLVETWLIFIVYLALLAGLVAATVIDARLYIIPLEIPWTNTVIALILLPLATATFPRSVVQPALPPHTVLANQRLENMAGPYRYSASIEATAHDFAPQTAAAHPPRISPAPLVSGRAAAAGLGGIIGLAIAVFLLWRKLLPRSFDDELDAEAQGPAPDAGDADAADAALKQLPFVVAPALGATAAVVGVEHVWSGGWAHTHVLLRLIVAVIAAYAVVIVGGVAWRLRRGLGVSGSNVDGTTEQQVDDAPMAVFPPHPRPRREVGKECLFVAIPLLGVIAGAWLAPTLGGDAMRVLGGVMLGYLAGGAVVWATRIGGTLAFGKEAMGLGDVHLMAAVGAVCGWQVAVLAFFVAPFFGLVYAVLAVGLGGILRFRGHQIPYGPHLAVATFVVMIWREPLLAYFGALLNP